MTSHSKIYTLLKNAFKTAEKKLKGSGIDYSNSGTCVISVLIKNQSCYIANLGDSRAVLYRHTTLSGKNTKFSKKKSKK
jgi:serine/threonine protein phosphatase PrpC